MQFIFFHVSYSVFLQIYENISVYAHGIRIKLPIFAVECIGFIGYMPEIIG